jgi:ATP-dependent exoDNAse (exonuclease V) beta subunit
MAASLGLYEDAKENEKAWRENPYFRQSSLNAYLCCPAYWWLIYVAGVENVSGPAARLGTAVHRVCEIMTRAALGETEIGDEEIDELLRNSVAFGPGAVLTRIEGSLSPEDYDNALKMLEEWWLRDDVRAANILGVEWQFSHTIRGSKYTGTVDLVYRDESGMLVVRDYKTGFLQKSVRDSVQLKQ